MPSTTQSFAKVHDILAEMPRGNNSVISLLSPPTDFGENLIIISRNFFVKEFKCHAIINSLPIAPIPQIDPTDSDATKLAKEIEIEWGYPRKQLSIYKKKGGSVWLKLGSISLQSSWGYPFRIHNLLDLMTDNLAYELSEIASLGVGIEETEEGFLTIQDTVIVHGSYVEEVVAEVPITPIIINVSGGGTAEPEEPEEPPAPTDPNFANVSLLMHFDGVNNSTTFTDQKGHIFSAIGGAVISTTQSKFGGASLFCEGSNDAISTPIDTALNLAGTIFTLEAWIHPTFSGERIILSTAPGTNNKGYAMGMFHGALKFQSGNQTIELISSLTVPLNQWSHVAISKSGNNYYFGVNGTVETIANSTAWVNGDTILKIGGSVNGNYPQDFYGYIDEVRITKGTARYTANYTVPTAAFPNQ